MEEDLMYQEAAKVEPRLLAAARMIPWGAVKDFAETKDVTVVESLADLLWEDDKKLAKAFREYHGLSPKLTGLDDPRLRPESRSKRTVIDRNGRRMVILPTHEVEPDDVFVSHTPHSDGRFDYCCWFDYCRCMQ